jgi:hypothetical protein
MKRFALLLIVVLTSLAPLGASSKDAPNNNPKPEKEHKKTVPVPEPATIALLALVGGVAAARRLLRRPRAH